MRKIAAIIAIITAAASFASCSGKSEENTNSGKATAPKPSQTTVQTAPDTTGDPLSSSADGESEAEFSITTAAPPEEKDLVEYTTTEPTLDEYGYVYDKLESISLNDMILYDKDGIKVVGKEILSEPLEIDETLEALSIVCEITNGSDTDIDLNLREISVNNVGLGWANVYRFPSVKAGETVTDKFVIPAYSIIEQTGFNLGDIEKLNFLVTSVVEFKDNDGDPVEIMLK